MTVSTNFVSKKPSNDDALQGLRPARATDLPDLQRLVATALRELGGRDYESAQIESALADDLFELDPRMIAEGTLFVVEHQGQIVASGGWSPRAAPMPNEPYDDRVADPRSEAASLRSFFVAPAWAGRGLARCLLDHCESEARRAGFRCVELLATLTGARVYSARGFETVRPIQARMSNGVEIHGRHMRKGLSA